MVYFKNNSKMASSTILSSSGWTVRKSNSTASLRIREKIGGLWRRSALAKSSGPAELELRDKHFVGIVSTGTEPLPTWEPSSTTETWISAGRRFLRLHSMRRALFWSSSKVSDSMR